MITKPALSETTGDLNGKWDGIFLPLATIIATGGGWDDTDFHVQTRRISAIEMSSRRLVNNISYGMMFGKPVAWLHFV